MSRTTSPRPGTAPICEERDRLFARLDSILGRIEKMSDRLRAPEHDEEVSSDLWQLCAAYEKTKRRLLSLRKEQELLSFLSTREIRTLPKATDPIWKNPQVLQVILSYLDSPT